MFDGYDEELSLEMSVPCSPGFFGQSTTFQRFLSMLSHIHLTLRRGIKSLVLEIDGGTY